MESQTLLPMYNPCSETKVSRKSINGFIESHLVKSICGVLIITVGFLGIGYYFHYPQVELVEQASRKPMELSEMDIEDIDGDLGAGETVYLFEYRPDDKGYDPNNVPCLIFVNWKDHSKKVVVAKEKDGGSGTKEYDAKNLAVGTGCADM